MLNEFLCLQFTLCVLVCFFIFFWDSLFLIINAVLYLGTVALFAWTIDSDIYINFLVIIDLGVFFVLLGFLLNFISLFRSEHIEVSGVSPGAALLVAILPIICIGGTGTNLTTLPFTVTLYDWYSLYSAYYFTDLQLLSELYYVFAGLEFILMNCYLYITILVVYLIRQFIGFLSGQLRLLYGLRSPLTVRGNFMRTQDIQSQVLTRASVRVWGRD